MRGLILLSKPARNLRVGAKRRAFHHDVAAALRAGVISSVISGGIDTLRFMSLICRSPYLRGDILAKAHLRASILSRRCSIMSPSVVSTEPSGLITFFVPNCGVSAISIISSNR